MELILAMTIGRLIWGLVMFSCMGFDTARFGMTAFLSGALLNAIPGIIVQLILIPILVVSLGKISKES